MKIEIDLEYIISSTNLISFHLTNVPILSPIPSLSRSMLLNFSDWLRFLAIGLTCSIDCSVLPNSLRPHWTLLVRELQRWTHSNNLILVHKKLKFSHPNALRNSFTRPQVQPILKKKHNCVWQKHQVSPRTFPIETFKCQTEFVFLVAMCCFRLLVPTSTYPIEKVKTNMEK